MNRGKLSRKLSATGWREDRVRLTQRLPVDHDAPVPQMNAVTGQADNPLHQVQRWVHGVVETRSGRRGGSHSQEPVG